MSNKIFYKKIAKEYSSIGIVDSFYLAFRDLPDLIKRHIVGKNALDYGCGSGRSTLVLKKLGLNVVGVDNSSDMIKEARKLDPKGKYELIESGNLPFKDSSFDLVLVSIVLLGIKTKKEMSSVLLEIRRTLKKSGKIIIITSTPETHKNNWASFICDLPENKNKKSGERVKAIFRKGDIVFYDYLWFDKDYKEAFSKSNLHTIEELKPMPTGNEPYKWYSEKSIPLWKIYILESS